MKLSYRPGKAMYLLAFLGLSLGLSAQERFSDINGTVKDATGSVVPGVKVTMENIVSKRVYELQTASDGSYLGLNLEPARYNISFSKQGFGTQKAESVDLLVGKAATVNVTLQVGDTSQSVTVTEAIGQIDFSSTKIATNITADEFDRLPKGRSFQTLALQATSVNQGTVEGGIQINGASGAENQFNIDGVSVTSAINGQQRQNALFEALAEVQVKTGGLDAEYGGAMGGTISAITKSGGNEFHGDLHYYLSGNPLSAAPVQRLQLNPTTERDSGYFQDTKFKDTNNEIGGSLGGPIVKNKLYFYTLFSPRFRRQENTYTLTDGKDTLKRDQTANAWFSKLSYDVTSKLRANFTYYWSPTRSEGSLPIYDGFCSNCSTQSLATILPNKTIGFSNPSTNYTGQIDYTVNPTTLITVRAGRFWDNYKSLGIPLISSVNWASSSLALPATVPAIPAELRQGVGYANTPQRPNTAYDIGARTYFQIDGSKFVNFGGQHNFKAGWGTQKTVNKVNTFYPGGGYVRIFWNGGFSSAALGANQRGAYGYYEVNENGTGGSTGGILNNFYFQDNWKIASRLTMSLGLRFESESVPSFARAIKDPAFSFGFGDKIAPRLGASYDVFGNGKVKIYGSYGRNYDWVKYELSRGTFGGDYWRIYYRTLDSVSNVLNLATTKEGRNIWNNTPGSFRDRRLPGFELVDPSIKPMASDLYNLGTEIQLSPATVLRVGYVHNQLVRTIEDLGALNAAGDEVYIYANPGEGLATTQPTSGATKAFPMPKPDRRYDAVEMQLTRRLAKGYYYNVSYTISRLYGNYAGISNSDELSLPSTGRSSATAQQLGGNVFRQGGNANRAWDLDEILFDSKGNSNIKGRLATDRPHVFKFFGGKDFSWGKAGITNASVGFYAGSGTPITTQVWTVNQIPIFVNGRGDMGRTPFLTQTDLNLYHDFRVAEGKTLRFEMNMLNLFNQKTSRAIYNGLNRGNGGAQGGSAIDLSRVDLTKGFDYNTLIAGTADARGTRGALDPLYGKQDLFNTGFQGRFGIKFIF